MTNEKRRIWLRFDHYPYGIHTFINIKGRWKMLRRDQYRCHWHPVTIEQAIIKITESDGTRRVVGCERNLL